MANDVWSFGELHGNPTIIKKIMHMAKAALSEQIPLCAAKDDIKRRLSAQYGDEWYQQSADAVKYIIEDVYSSPMKYKEMGGYLNFM